MVTTGAATAIAVIVLMFSCVIGASVGFLLCRVLHISWNFKVAVLDMILTVVTSIASAYGLSAIASAQGKLDSGVTWIVLSAVAIIVIRHLGRFALRNAH